MIRAVPSCLWTCEQRCSQQVKMLLYYVGEEAEAILTAFIRAANNRAEQQLAGDQWANRARTVAKANILLQMSHKRSNLLPMPKEGALQFTMLLQASLESDQRKSPLSQQVIQEEMWYDTFSTTSVNCPYLFMYLLSPTLYVGISLHKCSDETLRLSQRQYNNNDLSWYHVEFLGCILIPVYPYPYTIDRLSLYHWRLSYVVSLYFLVTCDSVQILSVAHSIIIFRAWSNDNTTKHNTVIVEALNNSYRQEHLRPRMYAQGLREAVTLGARESDHHLFALSLLLGRPIFMFHGFYHTPPGSTHRQLQLANTRDVHHLAKKNLVLVSPPLFLATDLSTQMIQLNF